MKTLTHRLAEANIDSKTFHEAAKAAFSTPSAIDFLKLLGRAVPLAGLTAAKDVNETYFNEGQRNTVVEICRYAGIAV